jgi:hypothetical protein
MKNRPGRGIAFALRAEVRHADAGSCRTAPTLEELREPAADPHFEPAIATTRIAADG